MKVQETPVAVPNRDEEFPAQFPNRLYIAPSHAIFSCCKHHQCVITLVEAVVELVPRCKAAKAFPKTIGMPVSAMRLVDDHASCWSKVFQGNLAKEGLEASKELL